MAKLYAIADLHLAHQFNATEWQRLKPCPPGSGLILAGDIGESATHLVTAFERAKACFTHVFWVPGNHELYNVSPSMSAHPADRNSGEAKYMAFVEVARSHGVLTPEDDWMLWPGPNGTNFVIALIFTLYDYSFRPAHVSREKCIDWAIEADTYATDEVLLLPEPYATRDEWCSVLCDKWERKFTEYAAKHPDKKFVIVNHWPLREDLIYIPLVPRFTLWCGTKRTQGWGDRGYFGENYQGAEVVVTGHLHVRRTDVKDGVRYEEVSLGYPRQWDRARQASKGINDIVRDILPGSGEVLDGGHLARPLG